MAIERIKIDGDLMTYDGFQLLMKNLLDRFEQMDLDPTITPISQALGVSVTEVTHPEDVIDIMAGILDLAEMDEDGKFPLSEDEIIGKKGYSVKRYGERKTMGKMAYEWLLKATKNDSTLPDVVIKDINKLIKTTERLVKKAQKAKNFEITRVLTNGFTKSAKYGAGSPAYDGEALFSNTHPYGEDEAGNAIGNNDNLMTKELAHESLLEGIELLRDIKDENGTRIGVPGKVTLVIPRKLERTARQILSGGINFEGAYASNDSIPSVFSFEGYRVEMLVLDTLGQPSKNGEVGDDKQWFLINMEAMTDIEAFKLIYLYNDVVEMFYNKDTKKLTYDIDVSFGTDMFDYKCVVGSTGVDAV